MVSSANRNIRIWDLSDNKLVSDIYSNHLNYFVRSLAIHPEKQLLAAACDKLVTLWDLRQASNEGVLRGHKEEVRCLHINGNYLFTAGKGLNNSGSLLVWDLRYLNFNTPMEEKERNQDIFTMVFAYLLRPRTGTSSTTAAETTTSEGSTSTTSKPSLLSSRHTWTP
jgi:WD40 repeat protein